ncbi:hypothetical protein B0T17DRAFT_126101 [Bombardia bombarda]|uniref:Uncharacterized protein n=1 Tax=Bombardia bombarda TaxID=252184 RepID=A0AA39U0W6_9PEZI|nr:hypothetical protein B0T17DRAFT_126101 [Bombardia bombarda]
MFTKLLETPFDLAEARKDATSRETVVFAVFTRLLTSIPTNPGGFTRKMPASEDLLHDSNIFMTVQRTSLEISSPFIINALRDIVLHCPTLKLGGFPPIIIDAPYSVLGHHLDDLMEYMTDHRDIRDRQSPTRALLQTRAVSSLPTRSHNEELMICDERAHIHLGRLLDFLRQTYGNRID